MSENFKLFKSYKHILIEEFDSKFYSTYFVLPFFKLFPQLALLHFYFIGIHKNLRPNENFDPYFYKKRNHDVVESGMNVWLHYLLHGKGEGRKSEFFYRGDSLLSWAWRMETEFSNELSELEILYGFFDEIHYRRQLKRRKIIRNKNLLIKHYLKSGNKNNLSPASFFDSEYYKSQLKRETENPFLHFVKYGSQNGLMPNSKRLESDDYIIAEQNYINSLNQDIANNFEVKPLISIIIPVYKPKIEYFKKAIQSIESQLYSNYEVCIADDFSEDKELKSYLDQLSDRENYNIVFRGENGHISKASNDALKLAGGDYILLMDQDDEIAPHALYEVVKTINENEEVSIIYSDEDKFDEGGFFDPNFKPDWNYKLLLSQNYINHISVFKHSLIKEIGGFRLGFEGSQDYDLCLRAIEKVDKETIIHINKVLYHWRVSEGSTAYKNSEKSYAYKAGKKAIESHLQRTNQKAKVEEALVKNYYRVNRDLYKKPLVSVLIPTRNYLADLKVAVKSVLDNDYSNFEIIILNNDSDDKATLEYFNEISSNSKIRVLDFSGEFNFSAINNYGVENSKGDLILFLNNDIESIDNSWLSEMVSEILPENVGVVGARLLYPDNKVQHAGVGVGGNYGVAGHAYMNFEKDDPGDYGRAMLIQNYPAVTGACMLVKKDLFSRVEGFDDVNLKVAFNDVDLCLEIGALNKEIVWTPYALLYHYESKSRGSDMTEDKKERFRSEIEFMKEKYNIK